jgi:hypothetical protein
MGLSPAKIRFEAGSHDVDVDVIHVILFGAELNSEIEHQTAVDSTVGLEKPLGARGATMTDTAGAQWRSAGEPNALSAITDAFLFRRLQRFRKLLKGVGTRR